MRRNLLFFLSCLLFLLPLTACKKNSEIQNSNINKDNKLINKNKVKTEKKLLLVSFTILEDIVKNIVGDEFKVESITKPGMEVHGYQVTPSDLVRGSKAIIFIQNGFGFELWAEKFVTILMLREFLLQIILNQYLLMKIYIKVNQIHMHGFRLKEEFYT